MTIDPVKSISPLAYQPGTTLQAPLCLIAVSQ